MEAIRKKIAVAYFGDEGLHASPIIDLIMKILAMLLSGGICPTPAKALAWAKAHPRLTAIKTYYYAAQATDDAELANQISVAVGKVIPGATDEEAAEVAATAPA